MKRVSYFLVLLAATVLVACAGFDPSPADTFNKKLAAGYTTVAAVAETATTLVKAGKLSSDDARKVHAALVQVVAALDAAEQLAATDLAAAGSRLEISIALLTNLQAYLAAHKGVPI